MFFKNLVDNLAGRIEKRQDNKSTSKVILITIFSIIGILFFSFFGILAITGHRNFLAIVLLSAVAITIANLIYLNIENKPEISGLLIIIIAAVVFLFLFGSGGTLGTGYTWIFSFPVLSIAVLGLRKGTILSISLLVLICIYMFIDQYLPGVMEYNFSLSLRLFGSYLLVFLSIYSFEYLRIYSYQKLEKSMEVTKNESKRKDDFISKLSHQIRTPLNNLTLVSNLVNDSNMDQSQKDLFETIIASTNNLIDVVNNIVKVSPVEIEKEALAKVSFDLYSTINNTLNLFREQKRELVDIKLSINKPLKFNLIGDPIRIKQVFLNLIENIVKLHFVNKYILEVKIQVEKETNDQVHVLFNLIFPKVQLMEDEHENYLTRPIEDSSNETFLQDAYLDFTVAHKIIQFYGGKFSLSQSDEDTEISFNLVLFKDPSKKTISSQSDTTEETDTIFHTGKRINLKDSNVLLVEDNAINQKIVLLSLKNKVGNIDVASNGKEALDKFGTQRYDIILMDIQMPVMNGIVATKKIRELEVSTKTHTPIIAITANALTGDKETCLAAGMNDYISKPFQVEILLEKMDLLLERSKSIS
jgi:CheY-like chemotaxis protein/signal transduction histidine kinase